jgi:hypothetical protein
VADHRCCGCIAGLLDARAVVPFVVTFPVGGQPAAGGPDETSQNEFGRGCLPVVDPAELLSAAAGRTTLLVAHRLATLGDMDEIGVLDAGRVVEHGTHARLLVACGRYGRMWDLERDPRGSGTPCRRRNRLGPASQGHRPRFASAGPRLRPATRPRFALGPCQVRQGPRR